MRDVFDKPQYTIANRRVIYYQKQLAELIGSINRQFIYSRITTLDARDNLIGRHSFNVAELASNFAKYIELLPGDVQTLNVIGLAHDIGKIGIPEYILTKPGKLTADEYETIKSHPSIGADILRSSDIFFDIADSVRHHHERYDGTGYPDGLTGEAIPFFSRIIALGDAFDAMTSKRCYHESIDVSTALEEILVNGGSQFDPILARQFTDFIRQYKNNKEHPYSR